MAGLNYLGRLSYNDYSEVMQRIGKGKICTHVSLFSGCGGLDCGFAQAGIQTRVMIEFDHSCCETLRWNFLWEFLQKRTQKTMIDKRGHETSDPKKCVKVEDAEFRWKNKEEMKKVITWYHEPEPVIFERDIHKVSSEEILKAAKLQVGECSIVSGGFPCQGFSTAGKRVIDDPRNSLYKEFVRIVRDIKPASIFGENVPGLVSMAKGEIIKQICDDFAELGYDITWDILNAASYGVPQNRKRVIFIGKRVDEIYLPEDDLIPPKIMICAHRGMIKYPKLFYDRIKKWKNKELLEKIQNDPYSSFTSEEYKIKSENLINNLFK